MKDLTKYGQYKHDIFNKLNFDFKRNAKTLDVGCGNGSDAEILIKEYGVDLDAFDVYEHNDIKKVSDLRFQKASIYDIPFEDKTFDYVYLHDVLHHIDEENQAYGSHFAGLCELKRVTKPGGSVVIVEGNRYNPLFYPHMVKMLGHDHWPQSYFKKVVRDAFSDDQITFKYFEAHAYPWGVKFWKVYEYLMEELSPNAFLAYNIAIIEKV